MQICKIWDCFAILKSLDYLKKERLPGKKNGIGAKTQLQQKEKKRANLQFLKMFGLKCKKIIKFVKNVNLKIT